MDERTSLSRRKLLHTLAGAGVITAADLAWWDAPLIGPRKAWGAEPVRFQWSVPEPTRIARTSIAQNVHASPIEGSSDGATWRCFLPMYPQISSIWRCVQGRSRMIAS